MRGFCFAAGFCLHGRSGSELALFEAALVECVQRTFKPKSLVRRFLKVGFLDFELVGATSGSSFFHVAYGKYSSGDWRFIFLPLQ
jgi:hypothetical protein